LPSLFFVSVADRGLSGGVSGLESTVTGGLVSVDSSRLKRANVQGYWELEPRGVFGFGGGSGARRGRPDGPVCGPAVDAAGRADWMSGIG
jgi:hypothetical protein